MSKKTLTETFASALKKAYGASKTCMPVTFVGMYDCGKNFVFGHLGKDRVAKGVKLIKIDLAGTFGETKKTLEAISLSFKAAGFEVDFASFKDLKFYVTGLCKKNKILLAFNFPFMEEVSSELVLSIYSLRNLLGYQVNWISFANYGFLHSERSDVQNIYEKIFFSDVYFIQPHKQQEVKLNFSSASSLALDSRQIDEVFTLSGGNSGLIRALGLMLTNGKKLSDWEKNLNTMSRIRKIISELTNSEIEVLLKQKADEDLKNKMTSVGFLNSKGEIFSLMVKKLLLKKNFNKIDVSDLTPTQEAVWNLLLATKGKLVSRDEIAQVLWGNNWQEKYSDWAIDQSIYSLRQKLIEIGASFKIVTKKAKGFVLENLQINRL